jgi:DNA-binding response OmpR family regulator
VVEDVLLLADMIAEELQDDGCQVVGPVGRVEQGFALADREQLDGALLDVNLAGESCLPIARRLTERGIPFAFLTGYDESFLPASYRTVPRLMKPFRHAALARLIEGMFGKAA